MTILARGVRRARMARAAENGVRRDPLNAQMWCKFREMHQNKDAGRCQSGECTCLVRSLARGFEGCMPRGASIPRKRARSSALRRVGAYMAQKLLYWCRSICPGRLLCSSSTIEGGRAGTGQLDWAAAESAEFVNQEIGYE
jgi:hypothetical protein